MTIELFEDYPGDPRNARTLAQASKLAYLPAEEGTSAFLQQLDLKGHLISVGNTQVYVAENDDHIVLAFRGSESPTSLDGLKDWLLTNAINLLIVPEGRIGTDFAAAGVGALFHQGFMSALADIWDPMFADVKEAMTRNERPLWVTGHSLGGALALLAAWRLQRNFISIHQVVTFGAPMVGNDLAAKAFDREFEGKIFRYVNNPDLVPRLPTISLLANSYIHCNKEMALGEASDHANEVLNLFGTKTTDGVLHLNLMNDLWDVLKQRLAAHDIGSYFKLIS